MCGSTGDWFRHDSRDVETIFLSRIDMDGGAAADPGACSAADATAPDVRFGCRAGGAEDGDLARAAATSGEFVGNGRSEGPLRVLGTWSIAESAAGGLDCKGSFGADLKP